MELQGKIEQQHEVDQADSLPVGTLLLSATASGCGRQRRRVLLAPHCMQRAGDARLRAGQRRTVVHSSSPRCLRMQRFTDASSCVSAAVLSASAGSGKHPGNLLQTGACVGARSDLQQPGVVHLTIGYHQLEGKQVPLKKSLAIMEKREGSSQSGCEYHVSSACRPCDACAAALRAVGRTGSVPPACALRCVSAHAGRGRNTEQVPVQDAAKGADHQAPAMSWAVNGSTHSQQLDGSQQAPLGGSQQAPTAAAQRRGSSVTAATAATTTMACPVLCQSLGMWQLRERTSMVHLPAAACNCMHAPVVGRWAEPPG